MSDKYSIRAALELTEGDLTARIVAAETLGALGSVATSALDTIVKQSITDPEPPVRYALLDALERIGWEPDSYIRTFVRLLSHPDEIAQARAAWALGRVGPGATAAVPDLTSVAADTGRLVDPRWSAVVALERLGPASRPALPTLLALLDEPDPDMREAIARALGAISDEHPVVSALIVALDDPDQLVRESAAIGLGSVGPSAAAAGPALRSRCADGWPAVAAAARDALRRIGEEVPQTLSGPDEDATRTVRDRLPQRLADLRSEDERTRGISTFEIGKLGPGAAEAVPLLSGLLSIDRNLDVRWSAAWALGKMGAAATEAVPALARAIVHDRDPDVRAESAWALGRIAREHVAVRGIAVRVLSGSLRDVDSLVREEAASALGSLGPDAAPAIPGLALLAADRHSLVRQRALDALLALGDRVV